MRRREFIAGLARNATVRAVGTCSVVVGFVGVARGDEDKDYPLFAAGLREAGFVDQQNVVIARREVIDVGQLKTAALELVRNKVAVICGPSNAIVAAKAATSTIPLVFIGGRDAVATGLVSSFNQPSGNVTGVSLAAGELMRR